MAAAAVAVVPSPGPRWRGSPRAARPCGSPRSGGRWSCSSPTCAAGGARGCSDRCTCRSRRGYRCCQLPSGHWSLQCPGLGWEQRSSINFILLHAVTAGVIPSHTYPSQELTFWMTSVLLMYYNKIKYNVRNSILMLC